MTLHDTFARYNRAITIDRKTMGSTIYGQVISQSANSVVVRARGSIFSADNLGTGSLEEGEAIILLPTPDGGFFSRGRSTLSY